MEKIIEDFFGIDAIASNNALHDLISRGEESLELVIEQFDKRGLFPQLEMQLGHLFGHFGNASLPKLIEVLKGGNWHTMVMASPCFRDLPHEPAGAQLMQIISSGNIDKERLAIEALGYLGTSNWNFELKDKVTRNDSYDWGKLSYYLFVAFFRIAIKAKTQENFYFAITYIQSYYKLAGPEEFKKLWDHNWYSMEIIFSDFKPVAGDAILSKWLRHEEFFFRELGLKALGWMRLNRSVNVIKQMAISGIESVEVVRQCANSLSMIDSVESANALKVIFEATPKTNDLYKSVALYLAMSLGRLTDKEFIEKIYPELMMLGGETEAHTLYNLGLLGFPESIWMEGVNSEEYIVRASVAPAYARRVGAAAIPKLLQMEREASHEIEKTLILSALMIVGYTTKKQEFLSAVYSLNKSACLRMFRITWKREIVFSLYLVEATYSIMWENMVGIEIRQVLYDISELENNFKKSMTKKIEEVQTDLNVANTDKEIFISYGWGGESEKIVDAIYDTLIKEGFHIIRDKIVLDYKGNIKEFMESIGRGKYVIVIISDKYLRSDNCMFEMLKLKERGDLYERIFPIVLNDAKIYKDSERLDYLIYWDKEIKQLNKKLKQLSNVYGTELFIQKINQYHDIRRIMDEITDLLRNMNTLTPDIHQDDDFSALISEINKIIVKDDLQ